MKITKLLLLILVFFIIFETSAIAHDHHEGDSVSAELYKSLTDVFTEYLLSDPFKPHEFVPIGKNSQNINLNAIQTLAFIASMRVSAAELQKNPALLYTIVIAIIEALKNIPTKIITPKKSVLEAIEYLKSKILEGERGLHRLAMAHNPMIFFVIAITQGAWEAFESAVMPGGIHLACTIFNVMLLAAVLPFSSWIEHALIIHNKLILARMFANLSFGKEKIYFHLRNQGLKWLKFWKSPTDVQNYIESWGLRATNDLSLDNVKNRLFEETQLLSEPNNLSKNQRMDLVFFQLQMLKMLDKLLSSNIEQATEVLYRRELLILKRIQGRINKANSLYSAMIFAVAKNPSFYDQSLSHRLLIEIFALHHKVSSIIEIVDNAHHKIEHFLEHNDSESLDKAEKLAAETRTKAYELLQTIETSSIEYLAVARPAARGNGMVHYIQTLSFKLVEGLIKLNPCKNGFN